jgi:hypothetical protein
VTQYLLQQFWGKGSCPRISLERTLHSVWIMRRIMRRHDTYFPRFWLVVSLRS